MASALLITLTALLAYISTVAIYRLFLHPLRKIPGPRLAALTSLYETYYDVIQPGRFVFKINELHKTYGPIIRVTPREVHVNDVDFAGEIYTTSHARRRDKDPVQIRGVDIPLSTAAAIDHEEHRRRRAVLSPYFAPKQVFAHEDLIAAKTAQLCAHLDSAIGSGEVRNLHDIYYAFARDVVYQVAFGRDTSNVLGSLEGAAALRSNLTRLLFGTKAVKRFPWLFKLIRYMPAALADRLKSDGVKDMTKLAIQIKQAVDTATASPPLAAATDKPAPPLFAAISHDAGVPADLKSAPRFIHEGMMLVMAGTEATAKTLGIVTFHLLAQPALLARLRADLAALPATSPRLQDLLALPFLSALIAEGNRLAFGLSGRNARICPAESLQYAGYTIPAGTSLSCTTLAAHTDPRVFPRPWAFEPDRWLGEAGRARQRFNLGFGRGARACLGMHIANAEMARVLAAVAAYQLELFETSERDVGFEHDYQVAHPWRGSKGVRVRVLRRAPL